MDRIIALLSALVGLIALGGALLVHNNADANLARQADEIAELRLALSQLPAAAAPAPAPVVAEGDGAVAALSARLAELEQTVRLQAAAPAEAATPQVAVLAPAPAEAGPAAAPAADGPTTDCIPSGTRFMAQAGDSFPICRTRAVVSVSAVGEGSAIIEGAGPVVAGGFGNLAVPGCTVMVFSADPSGYAEMRVSCV